MKWFVKMDSLCFILFILMGLCYLSNGSHFRGGIIMWEPDKNSGNPLNVSITIRVAWRRNFGSSTYCDQGTIDRGDVFGPGDLKCLENCAGFPSTIAPFRVKCTDFSLTENWSTGENTFYFVMPSQGPFVIGTFKWYKCDGLFGKECCSFSDRFQSGDWISLVQGGGDWSLASSVNLTRRSDINRINSSPRSSLTPIIRLQHGCNHTIPLPVNDADGDTIRCRWAEGAQECAGVCRAFVGATLDELDCTIKYSATGSVGWYAVAIMVEDFAPGDVSTALSSIPLQFLVLVFSSDAPCSSKPEFYGDTPWEDTCIGVPIGWTWTEEITVKVGGTDVSIDEITTNSPLGFQRSDLFTAGSQLFAINVSWTPESSQAGSNILCYTAADSVGLQTDQICITLLAGPEAPLLVESSQSPTGEVLPTEPVWTLEFDKPIIRPTRVSTYINFHSLDGRVVYKVDSTSDKVSFPSQASSVYTLEVSSSYTFTEKETYYITLDRGIVTGVPNSGQCAAESFPFRDTDFWRVKIKDVTPPVLTFTSSPSYTNENVTLTWLFNEEAVDTCSLQSPDGSILQNVPCTQQWAATALPEGWHTLYITAVDTAENVAPQRSHDFYVDKTPPLVTLDNQQTEIFLSGSEYTVRFYCSEYQCTYMYTVTDESSITQDGSLSTGQFVMRGLQNEKRYTFSVRAVDRVGNVGEAKEIVFDIDTLPPVISGLSQDVAVNCGEDLSPDNPTLNTPQVLDNRDVSPTLNYTDQVGDGCLISRTWTATDRASNEASLEQTIRITSPRPPEIVASNIIIPCSAATDLSDTSQVIRNTVTVSHPCNMSVDLNYQDSSDPNMCGITFTRSWRALDSCGLEVTTIQSIQILPLVLPEYPEIGQINVDLHETLRWPEYPGTSRYSLYIWPYGTDRPDQPLYTGTERYHSPRDPLPPGTQLLWQVEYLSDDDVTMAPTPSPVWGFVTRPYPDLRVSEVLVPDFAYSGQTLTVSWTVENIGGASSASGGGGGYWYDNLYLGRTTDHSEARSVGYISESRVLDPADGYTDSYTIELRDTDIGLFYVFVMTDVYNQVSEIDVSNNLLVSQTSVDIRLTPPPNLQVTEIVIPSATFSGESISVRYSVTNTGSGPTKDDRWTDYVVLSTDEQIGQKVLQCVEVSGTLWKRWSSQLQRASCYDNTDLYLTTLRHTGKLQPGEIYSEIQAVQIDHRLNGLYYILIQTDFFDEIYEHANEGDNIQASEAIQIDLSPPPDLIISDLDVDTMWTTGETVTIKYTVLNNGLGATFEPSWTDDIDLVETSTGKLYRTHSERKIKKLQAGENYTVEFQYTVSTGLASGDYMVIVTTDSSNKVFEFNFESNNDQRLNITVTQALPDLTFVSFEADAVSNTTSAYVRIAYKVENTGEGPTHEPRWIDNLFLKHGAYQSTLIGSMEQNMKLTPGNVYPEYTMVFPVPEDRSGDHTISFEIDDGNLVTEENENNNVESRQLNIPMVTSDLLVDSIDLDASQVEAGKTLAIRWTVTNAGIKILTDRIWTDSIFISEEDMGNMLKIYETKVSEDLMPSASYEKTANLLIPLYLSGEYSLIVMTDAYKNVLETDDENNSQGTAIQISSPPSPDLIVSELEYDFDSDTNVLSVRWTGQNDGNSMVEQTAWRDAVSLARSSSGSDTVEEIGGFEVEAMLSTQQYYTGSISVVIPGNFIGEYYIQVTGDYENDVSEINGESNNQMWSTGSITLSDQTFTTVEIGISAPPQVIEEGNEFQLAYVVTNTGDRDSLATSWTDAIYMSHMSDLAATSVQNEGYLLSNIIHSGLLQQDSSYVTVTNIMVPFGNFFNEIYLYIVVDKNRKAGLRTVGSDVGAVSVVDHSLKIQQGPLPDLVFTDPEATFDLSGGQPIELTFNIANFGHSAVNLNFFAVLYLSVDALLDPFDQKLSNYLITDSIAVNETTTVSFSFTTPFDQASGRYYLIVVLDSINHVYEVSEENNVALHLVNMLETVSTDLVVRDVTMQASEWTYGRDADFGWSLRNNGSLTASGYKCDTVYMSADSSWDIRDVQIGDTVCGNIELQPYSGSASDEAAYELSDKIPLLLPDTYYGLVRSRSNIKDPDLTNNVGRSSNYVSVDLPVLPLDSELTGVQLEVGESKAYVIPDVPVDETLIVLLESDLDDAIHDMYVRYNTPATLYQFDAFSSLPLSANQEVLLDNTEEGRYYVLVQNNGDKRTNVKISAKLAVFEIRRVTPAEISNQGINTLSIDGTLFSETIFARLSTSSVVVPATQVYRFSSTRLYASFDMTSIPAGSTLDLTLVDTDTASEAQLMAAVTVVVGRPGTLSIFAQYPRALRVFEKGTLAVNYQNVGNSDLKLPLISVSTVGPGDLAILEEGYVSSLDSEIVLAIPDRGPGGVIPAGAFGTLTFEVSQPENSQDTGQIQFIFKELPIDDSPNLFLRDKDLFQPRTVSYDTWEAIWQNFVNITGSTMSTLQKAVSEMVTSLSLVGKRVNNLSRIINLMLQIADGQLTGDVILGMADLPSLGPGSFLPLLLQRDYSGYISKRRVVGPFGYGWMNNYLDSRLLIIDETQAVVYFNREELTLPVSDEVTLERDGTVYEAETEYQYQRGPSVYSFDKTTRLLIKVTFEDGTTIELLRDTSNRVKNMLHSDGQEVRLEYNSQDLVESALMSYEGETHTVYYTYDLNQRTLQSVRAGSDIVTYSYTSNRDLNQVTYQSGASMVYGYSDQNYLQSMQGVNENGLTTEMWTYTHFNNGRLQVLREPHSESIEYVYDERKALLATITEGMPAVYIKQNQDTTVLTYADQPVIQFTYNAKEKTYYTKNAAGAVTAYRVGDSEELITLTDPNGNTMSAGYDEHNRLSNITYPDGTMEMFHFNSDGFVAEITNRNGDHVQLEYDDASHVIGKSTGTTTKAYSYNSANLLSSATDVDLTIDIDYDEQGVPQSVGAGDVYSLRYTYNSRGQRTSLSDGNHLKVAYHYDEYYRLQEVKMVQPEEHSVMRLEYSPSGYITKKTHGNGATTTYSYAPSTNWLLELTNTFPNGSVASRYQYVYDRRGRPKSIMTLEGEWKLRYDKASQLTYWEDPKGKKVSLTYDRNGNRIKVDENGDEYGYEVNHLNQYPSYSRNNEEMMYDQNGNQISRQGDDGKYSRYSYDVENKVSGVETEEESCTYTYDALENLKSKTCKDSLSTYIVDPFGNYGSDIIREVINGQPVYYIHALEHGLAAKVEDGRVYYYQYDGQGSVAGIQDDTGSLLNAYTYDPFGNVQGRVESTHNAFLFLGQWGVVRQAEVDGLYWMRSRMYDAKHGRFLSPDRLGISGKSTNLYSYALNNPVVHRDPDGRIVFGVVAAGAIIGAITNAAIYSVNAYINPNVEFTAGGLAGAAVSGGITGFGVTLGAPVAGLGGIAITSTIGALGGGAGYLTTQLIDGKPINWGDAAYEAGFNGVLANFPRSMLGWSRPSSEFGKYWWKNPSTWRSLFNIPESFPLWKTLTLGNALATAIKIPFDYIKKNLPGWWNGLKDWWQGLMDWIRSLDPNDMIGPDGYGDAQYIAIAQTLMYKIRFENDANATAPAQRVLVTHTLDSDLDLRTFKLGSFGFGDFVKELDYTRAIYQDIVEVPTDEGYVVRVRAGLSVVSGSVSWQLETVDTNTGDQPVDPSIGFLPPNNGSTGQGFVTFSVKVKGDTVSGAVIDAEASIIFDTNEPIPTPPIFNTIDVDIPEVNITMDTGHVLSNLIELDTVDHSSGVSFVDLYVKKDDATYEQVLSSVKERLVVLPLPGGQTYQLVATAEDYVGNRKRVEDEKVFDVTVPVLSESDCSQLNNCSGRGNCSRYGYCECEQGSYGLDCSRDSAITEPPILEASALPGTEDIPVSITVNARPVSGSFQESVEVEVTNIPTGVSFSKGVLMDRTLTLQAEDLGSVQLTPPKDYSGDIALALEARVDDAYEASRKGDLLVHIEAKADAPNLQIMQACYREQDDFVRIQFESSLKDVDGSEMLEVYLYDLPQTYRILEGVGLMDLIESHNYRLSNDTVTEGSIDVYPTSDFQEFDFKLEAFAVERSNNDRAFTTKTIGVEACEGSTGHCASEPCLNGGSCYNDLGTFVCSCTAQYTGQQCEIPTATLPPVSASTRHKSSLETAVTMVTVVLLVVLQ